MNIRYEHRPWIVMLVAALLISGTLLVFGDEADAATTTRVMEITERDVNPKVPFKAFDGNPPKVYDFNGDGNKEIIAMNDNNWVYVFSSTEPKILAEVDSNLPEHWGARSFNGPEVAVLEQGGKPHLVTANSAGVITMFRFEEQGSTPDSFKLVELWERRPASCHGNPGMDAKVVFGDLDRNGDFEILVATEEVGLYVLNHDGSMFWKNCIAGGNAEPTVVDIDGNGWPEVVHVSDSGVVALLNGQNGAWKWGYNIKHHHNLGSASMPVAAGVGQIDGVGGLDIVVGARDSHDTQNYENDHAMLVALNSNGRELWAFQDRQEGNPLTYTRPVVADADFNGRNEVYWADWNTIGHKGGIPSEDSWKLTGPANFYRIDSSGNMDWRTTLGTWWQNKDVPIADVDGDGVHEMLANGPGNGGHDGIWYLDIRNGNKDQFVDVHPYKVMRAPVIADLWNTGTMQWVVEVGKAASGGEDGILVYNTNAPYRAIWPHVPYPSVSDQPTQPNPPPSGEFDASFSGVQGNEWWIQAQVSSSGDSVAKVDVRLDGGSWKPLKNEGWGWAASYHAPQGTIVQLRATSSGGATDTSDCYRWTDASKTACTSEPPPSGDFDASFSGVKGNEWWIQAQVSSSGASVAKVDVRLDGGSWQPLKNEGWGWGASYHAPQGTIVQLRATSSGGATDTSDCYRWTDASKVSCTSSGFEATFQPHAVGNDWWVEVNVQSSKSIVGVEAQLNGGSWQTLSKTDWGTWAKSLHAPDGTKVVFRAHSSDGQTATSQTYTWT